MKHLLLTAALSGLAFAGFAQNTMLNPFPKTISVQGIAEMEIIPDEIYVNVDLKEYEKKGSGKVDLEKIKSDFIKNVRSIGIPDSLVTIAAYDGFNGNPWWWKKKKKEELYSSITYQIKFSNSKKMDELVEKLDDNATQNFYITRTAHSKIEQYKKDLKIEAVKAAKSKALYLAESIGEKVGPAITINEPQEYYQPYMNNQMRTYATAKMEAAADAGAENTSMDFKKMKLRYDVNATFALQ